MTGNHRQVGDRGRQTQQGQRHSCPSAVGLLALLAIASQGCQYGHRAGTQDAAQKDAAPGDQRADGRETPPADTESSMDVPPETGWAGGGGGAGGAPGGMDGGAGGAAQLGSCFEIFPSLENSGPGAVGGAAHSNPIDVNLGSVGDGPAASVSIRYFNFCSDANARLLGVELTETPASGAPGSNFAVEATPAVGEGISPGGGIKVTFTPKTAGTHDAIVRYRVTHGDYVTRIRATRN